MPSTFRFFRHFLRPVEGAVVREETTYRRGDRDLPATLYRPASGEDDVPGWMALHGLTYRGREHESLVRLASALAASGAVVLVPDFPEWRDLRVRPEATVETIKAAVLELDRRGLVEPGRIGALGFSFGATQALVAASDPALDGHIAGVAAWGGYADIGRATRFGFSGDHELDGEHHHLDPDPYGRWILAGNYLTLLPEHRDDASLARALHDLAREAGRRGIMSWSPETDPLKAAARAALDGRQREVFDLLAPPAGSRYSDADRARLAELGQRIADAAVEREPLLDARPYLDRVPVPVFLAHGRGDRLMPWTELVRLERALPPGLPVWSGITSLFSHSFGEKRWPTPSAILEAFRFVRLMGHMLRLV
jgi:dienelactone hydrolase